LVPASADPAADEYAASAPAPPGASPSPVGSPPPVGVVVADIARTLRPEVDTVGAHGGEGILGLTHLARGRRFERSHHGDLAPGLVDLRVVAAGGAGDEAALGLIRRLGPRAPVERLAHDLEAGLAVLRRRAGDLASPADAFPGRAGLESAGRRERRIVALQRSRRSAHRPRQQGGEAADATADQTSAPPGARATAFL